ncbi:arginase [Reticulibacter mediterranei]|uniref:Arginase n=1 Tax=Reticulibacter mediterranei TaxID=2778369 RepID=A0A8J3N043_9CHLR|nr:arginase family protein [Reticulibacter mediterranei]GHO92542.1 arginase [Reticulibacter mediterranei]
MAKNSSLDERIYHLFGIPLRSGSHYPGSENDAQAYRDVGIIERLTTSGCQVLDEGDIAIPSYLPHHHIPPIKNWPGPRIAWDCVSESILPYLQQKGHVPLLIGGDCSMIVGATQALMRTSKEDVHILYIDGDIDGVAPQPDTCQSAAAMGLWLLTHPSPFWGGPTLRSSQITIIGWNNTLDSEQVGMTSLPLDHVQRVGPGEVARQLLQAIPASAPILLHFDIDVLRKQDMPAAYFPHADGLSLTEGQELLSTILADSRLRLIEVTEYASLRDLDHASVSKIIELLAVALKGV